MRFQSSSRGFHGFVSQYPGVLSCLSLPEFNFSMGNWGASKVVSRLCLSFCVFLLVLENHFEVSCVLVDEFQRSLTLLQGSLNGSTGVLIESQ